MARSRRDLLGSVQCRKEGWSWQNAPYRSYGLAFAWGKGIAGEYPEQEQRTRALAAWLRENTARTDTLFVWGHYTPIFTLADRLPGTRYVNTSVHMGNFDPAHLSDGFDPGLHQSPPTWPRRCATSTGASLPGSSTRRRRESTTGIASRSPPFPRFCATATSNLEVARPGGAVVYRRREIPAAQARRED